MLLDWYPQKPSDFMIIYAGVIGLGLVFFLRRRGPKGMLLRLRASASPQARENPELTGAMPPTTGFTHIQAGGERPLNVVFNYNGHSWDAYEVLGLPAGSSPEKVAEAFHAAMKVVDPGSKPFLEAAHRAIRAEWDGYKKAQVS